MFPLAISPMPLALRTKPDTRIRRVVALVSKEQNVPEKLIIHASRCRANVSRARQLAMYLSHVALGESLTAIGLAFGRDRTTVSYACSLMEDLRDDPKIDTELDRLEALLLAGEDGIA